MKRFLPLLLCLLLLTGCVKTPTATSSTPGSASHQSSAQDGSQSSSAVTSTPEADPSPVSGWQKVYLDTLTDLSVEFGRYVSPGEGAVTGLKFARLMDFNGDGVRELVVLIDRTVRLYTCREEQAVLLYEGEAGGRMGQTDASYVFQLNTQSATPCLILYHSQSEWTEEAITIVHLNEAGSVTTTELYATMPEDIWSRLPNGDPGREHLDAFFINGETVSPGVYDAVRAAALSDCVTVDAYTEVGYDSTVVNQALLDKLFYDLAHWDGFLLPDADVRCYTQEELSQFTTRELRLARNEIYARHGRTFQAADLAAHFEDERWYYPLYTPEEFDAIALTLLNKYELTNLSTLLAVEASGIHAENTEMIAAEEALSIAETYWDYHPGKLEEGTGYLLSISAEAPIGSGEGSYYVFRLHALENNDYWVTRELLYIDAHTGLTSTTIPE